MDSTAAINLRNSTQDTADRRKSARSIRKPELYAEEHYEGSLLSNGSTKRKRPTNGTGGENLDEDEDEDSLSEGSEGEADEEELREMRRMARSKTTSKPAPKKVRRSNGVDATLAIRSANVQSKAPSKATKVQQARARKSQANEEGLYAEVFGRGKSGEDAAAEWLRAYERNNVLAMCELVNFVLKCTGCDLKVEIHDIEDVDNVPSKLGDLQEEYQQAKLAEYPLISKLKQFGGFRSVLIDFFSAVVKTMHESSTLYEDTALFENMQVWIDTMSSASIRPFRHTATVMSLTISTALCEVVRDLQSSISTTRGQIETEKKKKSVNKGRVHSMQEKLKSDEAKLEVIDPILKDEFDVVFVHRYRDVDPRVRVECVTALGNWIVHYRQMFLEGQYLRYLGWLLSDTVAHTRSEVVKVLKTLFKNPRNVAALRAFTDRFRPRMVEMAGRDAEPGVRAETIELLDRLRDAELLEPDDIDTIGQLVYDTEPRVRKAVAKFFVSNIEDLYKANTEDLDHEQYAAALPKHNDDDYLAPTQAWIKFKCLAQTLTSYDMDEDGKADPPDRAPDVLSAAELDSRYMLATQSIFPHMKDLQDWESLAGYLLYDHSQITAEPDDADVAAAAQAVFKLNEGEETVLLEVLDYVVKLYLVQIAESQAEKKGKKTQASKDEIRAKQELAAHNLTLIIPQLLNKFGSMPQAAAAILRLEHLLSSDFFNNLHQNETTYSALLEDINKQFMSHSDRQVLAEASKALVNGRRHEQSKEATDLKVQEMWDDALSTLRNLLRNQSIDVRGTLSSAVLTEVSNTVSRLANLASVSDCTPVLEGKFPPSTASKKQKIQSANLSPLSFLLQLARRGEPDDDTTAEFATLEDDLCTSVIKTLMFYFMWKILALRSSINANAVRPLTPDFFANLDLNKSNFVEVLGRIIAKRSPLDPVRLLAVSSVLDLYTLFSTLRSHKPEKAGVQLSDEVEASVLALISSVPRELQVAVMHTHDRLEKSFARKSRRKLEEVAREEPREDDAPIDSDEEKELNDEDDNDNDDDDDDDDEVEGGKQAKKQAVLLAEQRLCDVTGKIVLAVLGRAVEDEQKVRERLERNKLRLGPNYKEVVAYLEDKGQVGKGKGGGGGGGGGMKGKKLATVGVPAEKTLTGSRKERSAVMVLEDDDIEDDEMEGGQERRGEDDEDALREKGLVEDEEPEDGQGPGTPERDGAEDVIGD